LPSGIPRPGSVDAQRQVPIDVPYSDVEPRQHRQAGDSPRGGADRGCPDDRAGAKRAAQRDAAEIDEPVRGRDEERQIVEPVVVDAPDERAGHLADRREEHDADGLRPHKRGKRPQRASEHGKREHAERELPVE